MDKLTELEMTVLRKVVAAAHMEPRMTLHEIGFNTAEQRAIGRVWHKIRPVPEQEQKK
jgi:hypothetical protein